MGGSTDIDHCYNAVWEYDPGINQWAWMAGSDSANPTAHYGTQGQFSSSNHPNGRRIYAGVKDHEGKVWFFGGNNDDYWYNGGSYADLWKFDPDSLQWAWMSGPMIQDYAGLGNLKCIVPPNYVPRARMENSMRWIDACDNIWMYGGISDLYSQVIMDEMWVYSTQYKKWSIAYDSATASCPYPVYGTKGIAAPLNTPGCRFGGTPFQDQQGRMYVFGGLGGDFFSMYGDLFRFSIDSTCPSSFYCVPPVFTASDVDVCEKLCIDFQDMSTNNPTSWEWTFDGGTPSASNDQNPTNICYNNPGVFDVSLITTAAAGNDTTTYYELITVYATPGPPSITKSGDILTSSPAYAYQWQLNLVDIPGATNQSYTAAEDGYYTIVVYNESGCYASTTLYVQVTGIDYFTTSGAFSIFPNPNNGIFYCELVTPDISMAAVRIYDIRGVEIYHADNLDFPKRLSITIDISSFPPSIYFLELDFDHFLIRQKVILVN